MQWVAALAEPPRVWGLPEEHAMSTRTHATPARRRIARTRDTLGRAALLTASIALAAGCTDSGAPGPSGTTPEPSGTTTAPTATATTGEPLWVTAYFMVDTRAGLRLAREKQDMLDDSVQTAVEMMIAGPLDTDYTTAWNPQTEVLAVSEEAGLITIDLSQDARTANIGSEGAALMIQQLVYTATEAAGDPTAGVKLLIEGAPAGELWGAVTWDGPIARADPMDVRVLVQIDSPAENQVFTSPTVTISGEAAAFEANVPWTVHDASGAEVASGFTMTSEGQTFAPFSFDVDLPPGEYVVEISEDDPSDGAAGTPMTDTRTFWIH